MMRAISARSFCLLLCRRSASKAAKPKDETEISEIDAAPLSKELKKRCAYFIRKVYETDPLACPKCQGEMRIISLCVHADRSASLTSLMSLEKFFLSACEYAQAGNTWGYGKSPRPCLKDFRR